MKQEIELLLSIKFGERIPNPMFGECIVSLIDKHIDTPIQDLIDPNKLNFIPMPYGDMPPVTIRKLQDAIEAGDKLFSEGWTYDWQNPDKEEKTFCFASAYVGKDGHWVNEMNLSSVAMGIAGPYNDKSWEGSKEAIQNFIKSLL